jgi:hypothetical protein
MKVIAPIEEALSQLNRVDIQLASGLISKRDFDAQRLLILVDLLIAEEDRKSFPPPSYN